MSLKKPKQSNRYKDVSLEMAGHRSARIVGWVFSFILVVLMGYGFVNGNAPSVLSAVFGLLLLYTLSMAAYPHAAVNMQQSLVEAMSRLAGKSSK